MSDKEVKKEVKKTENKIKEYIDSAITGCAAGLIAGVGIGLVDSLRLWFLGGVDWTIPWFASILYGPFLAIIGSIFAVVWNFFLKLIKKNPFSRVGTGVFVGFILFGVFSFPIGFFYLHRDVFQEKVGLFSPWMLGSLAVIALILVVFGLLGSWIIKKLFSGKLKKFANHKIAFGFPLAVIAFLLIMSVAVGSPVRGYPLAEKPSVKRPNILVVVSDTHRADYTSVYSDDKDLTPNLASFAEDAVVYNGYANSSWTRPAMATILTGRYASSHTAMFKGSILPDEITTMPEVLLEGGYETMGIVTNYNLTPFFNVDQGFHYYNYLPPNLPLGSTDEQSKLIFIEVAKKIKARLMGSWETPDDYYVIAEVVTDEVLEKLDQRNKERPFFMFTVYMDPHDPYFRHPFDGHAISHRAMPNPDPNDKELIEEMKSLYRGEIKYWDKHFGRLIDGLKKRKLYDDMMIIMLSDHGEEFGEHGGFWHGTTLYDEQLRIPYIVKYPKGSLYESAAGQRVDSWYSLVDVAPMVLTEARLQIPPEMQGFANRAGEREPVFAEEDHQGNVLRSIMFENKGGDLLKLIEANENNPRGVNPIEMYNIGIDQRETKDISSNTSLVKEAKAALEAKAQKAREGRVTEQTGELTGAMKSQLEALGYMED